MKISVCIIGLNEEKNLTDCLRSVKPIADEIIYVDSLSKDKSCAIAKSFGARVFKQKFLGHVQQKNFAVSKAKFDWVLSLDCDERLSSEALASIAAERARRLADSSEKQPTSYAFNRLTFYIYRWIKHSGWYPDRKIRLFDRRTASWVGENPHDRVEDRSGRSMRLKGDILHYSFASISDHLKTIESFSEIAAHEALRKGRKSGPFTIIFRSLWAGIRKVFFEFSFLDGVAGLILTGLSMAATWSKYSKLYILQQQKADPLFFERNKIVIQDIPRKKVPRAF